MGCKRVGDCKDALRTDIHVHAGFATSCRTGGAGVKIQEGSNEARNTTFVIFAPRGGPVLFDWLDSQAPCEKDAPRKVKANALRIEAEKRSFAAESLTRLRKAMRLMKQDK